MDSETINHMFFDILNTRNIFLIKEYILQFSPDLNTLFTCDSSLTAENGVYKGYTPLTFILCPRNGGDEFAWNAWDTWSEECSDNTKANRLAKKNDLENMYLITKLLVSHGANVNYVVKTGRRLDIETTALVQAIFLGHLRIIKFLVDSGADIHLKINGGYNAITYASSADVKIVAYLLEKGADPNNHGCPQTPLCSAAEYNDTALAKILLNYGAYVTDDALESTPVYLARMNDSKKMMDILLDEYKKYFTSTKSILRYLEPENLWCILRKLTGGEIEDSEIKSVVYE